jgi:hypothetical protein
MSDVVENLVCLNPHCGAEELLALGRASGLLQCLECDTLFRYRRVELFDVPDDEPYPEPQEVKQE